MRSSTLQRRSLRYYWRSHVATALCAAVAATVLTGSLLVGDSMHASLRARAIGRLGSIDHALVAAKFFREELAGELAADGQFTARFAAACPLILTRGTIENASASARGNHINVFGVDERFMRCVSPKSDAPLAAVAPGSVVLNAALARKLAVQPGDDCLLRLSARQAAPAETLLGRPDRATVSLRLTVAQVIPASGLGELDLNLTQDEPLNAFVALTDLQRALKHRGRVNTILIAQQDGRTATADDTTALQVLLAEKMQLADAGLKLRTDAHVPAVVLESESLLIPPAMETAALAAAKAIRAPATPVLTYLANTMAVVPADPSREVPYSTVSGLGATGAAYPGVTLTDGQPAPALGERDILLNEWTAADLRVNVGDRVRMVWYTAEAFHRLDTADAVFTVRGIVRLENLAADPTLTPDYEGITDTKRLTDWDPPFPVDMTRIRDRDETYWEQHGPTPKAFVALPTAQQLWTAAQARFGRLSSIRLAAAPGQDLAATTAGFQRALLRNLSPQAAGLTFEPLRARALAASQGNTDFGALFLSFSIFLIASAAMLTVLLFRLGIQRRSAEIGLLLAVGLRHGAVMRYLLLEAVWPAGLGAAIGLAGALGYSSLMLAGLRSWWAGAIQADFLNLYAEPGTLLIGWIVSFAVAMLSIAWAVRGLGKQAPRELLLGVQTRDHVQSRDRKGARPSTPTAPSHSHVTPAPFRLPPSAILSLTASALALLLTFLATAEYIAVLPAFFAGGTAMLVAFLAALKLWTRSPRRDVIRSGGLPGIARLGIRNVARNPQRTLLTAGLVASAAFVITAVGANRRTADTSDERESGTGGFALIAESTVPILQDLNSPAGRRALSLSPATQEALANTRIMPFRLRPGDEASCAGLYQPTQPRILGATPAMIARGGFTFAASVAQNETEETNPWRLLERTFEDGAVPAIGDDSTVTWLLHLGLADDLVIPDEYGRPTRLRIVATLHGSALQSELIIPEQRFVEHFPSIAGYNFFLIEPPPANEEAPPLHPPHNSGHAPALPPLPRGGQGGGPDRLQHLLERDLSRYGLEVTPTAARLARYVAVENAYLTAFQTLGGLGLILGTLGLGAVLWRTVLDRRAELALLSALGYRTAHLRWLIWTEHTAILLIGLLSGVVSALLAITPQITAHPHNIPWLSLTLTLLTVLATGTTISAVAILPALRGRLPASLRND